MNQKLTDERERIIKVLNEHLTQTRYLQFLPQHHQLFSGELPLLINEAALSSVYELYELEQALDAKIKEYVQNPDSSSVKKTYMKLCKLLNQYNFNVDQVNPLKPDEGLERFVYIMKEMVNIYADKLHTTKEEEQVMNDQKNEKAAREKKSNADLKALQRELASVRSTREKEVSAREETLKKLEEELVALKMSTNNQREEFSGSMKTQEDVAHSKFLKFEEMLKDQIKQCELMIAELKMDHHKDEGDMKLDRLTSEQQVFDFVTKYDNFMSEHTQKYNQLVQDYNRDQKRVVFLENAIAVMEEEKRKRNEERDKRKNEKEKIERLKVHSRYQRLWKRAYRLVFLTNYEGIQEKVLKAKEAKNPQPLDTTQQSTKLDTKPTNNRTRSTPSTNRPVKR
ncbi:predicted protein [Naegleria gruberi]|uniref:Dynein regulatory complex protein 10 n=1 Tax=Naegleria gruberi TaxID=5762 RepID=D2UX61_NAEGR|nr:uncharacterized protein NAEGRDRAFT_45293 [Naegleria gruberi]EFC50875.1 predicted protein [Naegleria gruberi]|eukprot:XP_002683619.1 predicted protein [Naegleria gruberi strain NEG-M]